MTKWTPKKDDTVYLYYDGKRGRRIEGKVLNIKGFLIQVEFIPYCSDNEEKVTNWFPRLIANKSEDGNRYGGYLKGEGEGGIMKWLGLPGDWYSVEEK
jgi:hypothetical protein